MYVRNYNSPTLTDRPDEELALATEGEPMNAYSMINNKKVQIVRVPKLKQEQVDFIQLKNNYTAQISDLNERIANLSREKLDLFE